MGSQIKNGGLILLLGVDGLWVSRGFLKSLNVKIAFLRVDRLAQTTSKMPFIPLIYRLNFRADFSLDGWVTKNLVSASSKECDL